MRLTLKLNASLQRSSVVRADIANLTGAIEFPIRYPHPKKLSAEATSVGDLQRLLSRFTRAGLAIRKKISLRVPVGQRVFKSAIAPG
jgi:hypothetical protein